MASSPHPTSATPASRNDAGGILLIGLVLDSLLRHEPIMRDCRAQSDKCVPGTTASEDVFEHLGDAVVAGWRCDVVGRRCDVVGRGNRVGITA